MRKMEKCERDIGRRIFKEQESVQDSESAYPHSFSSHEHESKMILHSENPFILTKDNHFMIDMLNIENENQNEVKHATVTSTIERKSSKVMDSPTQYFHEEEDPINSNIGAHESMDTPYCVPGLGMVIKEDFYTDRNLSNIETPEMIVCIDADPFHIVENESSDEGVQSFDKILLENKELAEMECYVFSQSVENEYNDTTKEASISGGSQDLECALLNRDGINVVDNSLAEIPSVFHSDSDGKGSCVGSIDRVDELDTVGSMEDQLSVDVTKITADAASTVHINSDGNNSSLSSIESGAADAASTVHNDSDGDNSSLSSIESGGNLDTTESVSSNISDGKGSYVGLIYRGVEINTVEPMEGNLSVDDTEKTAEAASTVLNDSDGNNSSLSSLERGGNLDIIESVVSSITDESTETKLPTEEINTEILQVDSSSLLISNEQIQPVDSQISQDKAEETNSESNEISELSNGSEEITSNCKVPSGVITFKFDNQGASSSDRGEKKESRDNQQSEITQTSSETEEATDGAATSARSSYLHVIQEDCSSSGPAVLSGPIANSGHIPYSGSISLRSDSSTTSARSFAFPILQSEWNSSPVKMAKADRRRLRKHRGWRTGLLCCRF